VTGRGICTVDGCDLNVHAKGLCNAHRQRLQRAPSGIQPERPIKVRDPIRPDNLHRFLTHVGECWEWLQNFNADGYGIYKRNHQAHRVVYELLVAPIPEGLEIDHLCRNRRCVNPAHLEPVTHLENIRRGVAARAAERGAVA
jgi:hypothetical protein